jgi:hypothetical protein
MPADGTSLPSPLRKSRHPSRVRGSTQKIARLRSKSNFGKTSSKRQQKVSRSQDETAGIAALNAKLRSYSQQ